MGSSAGIASSRPQQAEFSPFSAGSGIGFRAFCDNQPRDQDEAEVEPKREVT
jgi:hypothetical protein